MISADLARPSAVDGGTERARYPYRHDIDGLRAVAILLVVAYHVWMDRVSGGVDVFLMISAFFLTLTFVRRVGQGERLQIGSFLAGRFRRLVPVAAVAIILILAAAWLLMSPTTWPQMWREGWSSLFYVENWQLAFQGVDYYARDSALASPFQHFWSLSVQGQVFVLWPLIFALAALLVRRTKRGATGILTVLFGVVFVVSLTYSIIRTQTDQTFAYFDTGTRLWEFAAGSLLALALPYIRLPYLLRGVLGWVGLAAIAVCGLLLDVQGGFPGYLALWPVIATALVVVGGIDGAGPARLLSSRPLRAIGGDAYALYLVHWPILIFWLTITGRERAGFLDGILIIVLALVLAHVLTLVVERPLRLPRGERGSVRRNLAVVAAFVVPVIVVTSVWQITARMQSDAASETTTNEYVGADAEPEQEASNDLPMLPQPIDLDAEWVSLDEKCRGDLSSDDQLVQESCAQTTGAEAADEVVVVVGDSHVEQMMAALLPVAEEEDWAVMSLLRGGCSLEHYEANSAKADECDAWQEAVNNHVLALHPTAVVTMVTAAQSDSPDERVLTGIDEVAAGFSDAGVPVIGIRDNPRFGIDMYNCALEEGDCDRPLEDALQSENPASALSEHATLIDFTPWLCPDGICRAEIGNLAVYLDDNHLTSMFATTLAPALREQLGGDVR